MDSELGDQTLRAGRLLVANPLLPDPNFDRTVVLLIATHDEGALGLVLNRPSPMSVGEPLPQWVDMAAEPAVLFIGGPVQRQAVIALARHDGPVQEPDGTEPADLGPDDLPPPRPVKPISPGVATIDLESDPSEVMGQVGVVRLFSGYAGWSAGQLEAEMEAGAWWVVDAEPADCFTVTPEDLWRHVLRRQPPPLCFAAYYPDDPENQ